MVTVPDEMIYIDWFVVQEAVEKQRVKHVKQFIDEHSRFIYIYECYLAIIYLWMLISRFIYILDFIYVYLAILHIKHGDSTNLDGQKLDQRFFRLPAVKNKD